MAMHSNRAIKRLRLLTIRSSLPLDASILPFTSRRVRAAKRLFPSRTRLHPPKADIVKGKTFVFYYSTVIRNVNMKINPNLKQCVNDLSYITMYAFMALRFEQSIRYHSPFG